MISLMISIVGVNLVDNLLEREPSFSYYAGGALTMVALIGFYALLAREGSDSKKEGGITGCLYEEWSYNFTLMSETEGLIYANRQSRGI
jgi:hypothetical protein